MEWKEALRKRQDLSFMGRTVLLVVVYGILNMFVGLA